MKKYLWKILPAVFIIGALFFGAFIYKTSINQETIEEQSIFSPSQPLPEIKTEEITPEPVLERGNLKLQILNGRGVAGVAGEAKDILEKLGYEGIAVGNADSFNYPETEISIKKDKESCLDLLREDLSEEYLVSENTETLATESEFDAVVTIGEE